MLAAEPESAKQDGWVEPRPAAWWRKGAVTAFARIAAALLVTVALVGGTGVVAAAAPPDSLFYPVKLAMEEASMNLPGDGAERVQKRLAIAEGRATELVAMVQSGSTGALEQAALRQEAAVQAVVREATRAGATGSIIGVVEAGFAVQAQLLQQAQVRYAGDSSEARACLGRALGVLERARAELRLHINAGGGPNSAAPMGGSEQEQYRWQYREQWRQGEGAGELQQGEPSQQRLLQREQQQPQELQMQQQIQEQDREQDQERERTQDRLGEGQERLQQHTQQQTQEQTQERTQQAQPEGQQTQQQMQQQTQQQTEQQQQSSGSDALGPGGNSGVDGQGGSHGSTSSGGPGGR